MLSNLSQYLAYTRKAIVQVIGLSTALLSLGLLPSDYAAKVSIVIGVLTTVLHFLTPNAEKPGTGVATENFDAADDDEDESHPDEWKPAALVTAGQVAAKHEDARPPSP